MENADTPNYSLIFGQALKARRMALSVSQEELAYRAGVDRTFVSRIERGIRQPTITTIFSLSHALEISASELVKDVESLERRAAGTQSP